MIIRAVLFFVVLCLVFLGAIKLAKEFTFLPPEESKKVLMGIVTFMFVALIALGVMFGVVVLF